MNATECGEIPKHIRSAKLPWSKVMDFKKATIHTAFAVCIDMSAATAIT
jgi:hypothetical protein